MKKLNTITLDVLYDIYSKYINHNSDKKDFRLVKCYTDENCAMFQQKFSNSVGEDDEQDEIRFATRLQIHESFIYLTKNTGAYTFVINAQMNEDLKGLGYEINYNTQLETA